MLAGVCAAIGWHAINTLFIFFATAYLGASQAQWPLILLVYLLAPLVGTPLVVRFAPRFEKHRMVAGCSLAQIALFALVLAPAARCLAALRAADRVHGPARTGGTGAGTFDGGGCHRRG